MNKYFATVSIFLIVSLRGFSQVPAISSFAPSKGPIGASVTIKGINFSTTPANNIVKFNGITATVTASTATSITAIVPVASTTGKINVTIGTNTAVSSINFAVTCNLFLNGGCEEPLVAGVIPYWTQVGTQTWFRDSSVTPSEGLYFFDPGVTAGSEIQQDVDVSAYATAIDAGTQPFLFSGYVSSYPQGTPDTTNIKLEFRDASNLIVLGAYNSGNNGNYTAWKHITTQNVPPVGTRFIRVRLIGIRYSGSSDDSYFDDISLIAVINPPTISSISPAGGSIGSTVTLTGTNFDPVPANNILKFNGVTAVVTASTATSITTTVPVGAATGPITLTVGCNAITSAGNFVIPAITSFAPSKGPIGASVTIVGTYFSATPANNMVTFNGVTAVVTASTTTSITATIPMGVTTGPISVSVGTSKATTATNFTPTCNLILNGGCEEPVVAGAIPYWTQIGTQTWIPENSGITVYEGKYVFGPGVTPGTEIRQDVNVTGYASAIDGGSQSFVFSGYVLAYDQTPPDTTNIKLEFRDASNLNVLGSYNSGNYGDYTAWRHITTQKILPVGTRFIRVRLIGIRYNGSYDDSYFDDISLTPLVNSPTLGSFSPTAGSIGSTVTLTGTNFDPIPANNFVRFNGTAAVVTASTATSITTSVPVGATAGTISVTVGCNTLTSSGTFALCLPPSAPSVTNGSGCVSTTVALSASGATGTQEYRWYNVASGGTSLSILPNFTTPVLSATTIYYVSIYTPAGGCESPRTPVVATVNSSPSQPAITLSGASTFCQGGSVTLSAPGFSSYLWSDGSTVHPRVVRISATGLTLKVTDSNGCQSISSLPVTIVVNPLPAQPVVSSSVPMSNGTVVLCLENNQTATLSAPSGFVSYSWSTGQSTSSLTAGQSGSYSVSVIDTNGCQSPSSIPITVNQASCSDIKVYNALSPNTDGKNEIFYLQYIDLTPETKSNKVIIFDRWGDSVWEGSNYDNDKVKFVGLNKNGDELQAGTYYYQINFPSGKESLSGFISLRR